MKLYRIDVLHAAPKDTHTSIQGYVIAKNDEQVYEWIKSEPELNGTTLFNSWSDTEEEGEEFDLYDGEYEVIGAETYKQKIIRLHGEIDDDSVDFEDAYYGITLYGWTEVKDITEEIEEDVLANLKIAVRI